MSHAYQDATEDCERSWIRTHGNGEQTYVHITTAGERYVVVAVDVDPKEFEAIEGEVISFEPTLQGAKEQALSWLENNPKGIAGGSGSRLMGLLSKLNDYGNSLDQTPEES